MPSTEKTTPRPENVLFSNRLRLLLEEKKTTQPVLAEHVGCTRQAISLYTTGQTAPDIHVLKKIAEYFGCSTDYLVGLSDTRKAEHAHILKATPLSPKSIEVLGKWNEKYVSSFRQIRMLNFLIERSKEMGLLENLYNYLFPTFFFSETSEEHKWPKYPENDERYASYKIMARSECQNKFNQYTIKRKDFNDIFFLRLQRNLLIQKRKINVEQKHEKKEGNNDGEYNETSE